MKPKSNYTGYNDKLSEYAHELRHNMTTQEFRLWTNFLRSYPIKFYRQRIIDNFIVDFYCSKAQLVIELDGSQHYSEQGEQYDIHRTEVLKQYNLKVIRFSNLDIDKNFEGVCIAIDREVQQRIKYLWG